MLVVGVRAGADAGDALVHERGRIRHRAHDRHAGREARLDLRGRDRGGDREDRLFGREQPADLPEQDVEVLRLHSDHDQPGAGDRFRIRERRLDAMALGELLQPLLAPPGDGDVARLPPARAEQPSEQRLADLPGAEDRDLPVRSHGAV